MEKMFEVAAFKILLFFCVITLLGKVPLVFVPEAWHPLGWKAMFFLYALSGYIFVSNLVDKNHLNRKTLFKLMFVSIFWFILVDWKTIIVKRTGK